MTWLLSLGIVLGIVLLLIIYEYLNNRFPVVMGRIELIIFISVLLVLLTILLHEAIWG